MAERTLARRDALRLTAVAGLSTAFGGSLVAAILRDARLRRVSETRTRMGTLVTLTAVHPDGDAAAAMIEAGFDEMARLESVLSRHRADAALGRLNAHGRLVDAPPELVTVLSESLAVAEASGGAFDPTVLPLLVEYERAFRSTRAPPTDAELRAAHERVDFRGVHLEGGAVSLSEPGMAVSLDGIAKGFIVDRTIDMLVAHGAERVLVDAGGDMATAGAGSARDPWTVAIQDPHVHGGRAGLVRLGGGCIATSGDYMHAFTADRRLHHILDPRTGRSPETTSSVSVVAPTAMLADALSTTAMVLGPEDGIRFLEDRDDVEGLLVTKSGDRLTTSGFPAQVT